ncbi:MAG TPA: biosynthetic peptidoglycan transglycosylase [Streptosporangiaceae bacterium]|nr:biosynthetic peptidoglycan transglycosylase [Streptosporangiaceae bacterium]
MGPPWQQGYQGGRDMAGRSVPVGGTMPGQVRWRKWLRRAALAVTGIVVVLVTAAGVIMAATPSVGNAWSLARAQAVQHHAVFPGPQVPAKFADALIATEDHRFRSEPGVDPLAIVRVLLGRLFGGGDQGGATLYQQLAKLLYTPNQWNFAVEVKQVALAIKLKYSYTSEQVLRMYATVAYFGHGYYGLEAASCGYFGRQSDRLSWPQAALLAGLVQAPSAYDPLEHSALARSREGHVIARLVATGALSQQQATAALTVPVARLTAGAGGCRA